MCNPSVLSPLHRGWSSTGKSLFPPFFPYRQYGPWNTHLFLSTLFVNALQKETFREGISCIFLQTSLSRTVLSPAFMSRSPTSQHIAVVHTLTSSEAHCWQGGRVQFLRSDIALQCAVRIQWLVLKHGMSSPFSVQGIFFCLTRRFYSTALQHRTGKINCKKKHKKPLKNTSETKRKETRITMIQCP